MLSLRKRIIGLQVSLHVLNSKFTSVVRENEAVAFQQNGSWAEESTQEDAAALGRLDIASCAHSWLAKILTGRKMAALTTLLIAAPTKERHSFELRFTCKA